MGEEDALALVLDAGALIALERGAHAVRRLVREARDAEVPVVVPAGALAQVWRGGARQAPVARVVRAEDTVIQPLDGQLAELSGILCGVVGTDDAIDASVVLTARHYDAVVVTSDVEDLRRLDPGLRFIAC